MFTPIQGELHAGGFRFAIVASRFNEIITRRLIEGALDCLQRHGADENEIDVYYCPGSFELPLIAKKAMSTGKYDAIVCVGAVIRGDTPHFDYIAAEVTKGIAAVSLEYAFPVAYGVLTTDSTEQALERAGLKMGNKGWEAALTAIELVNLFKKFPES